MSDTIGRITVPTVVNSGQTFPLTTRHPFGFSVERPVTVHSFGSLDASMSSGITSASGADSTFMRPEPQLERVWPPLGCRPHVPDANAGWCRGRVGADRWGRVGPDAPWRPTKTQNGGGPAHLRCLKVLTANENRAAVGFLDEARSGRRLTASQITAFNNRREAQWGVSPS